MEDMKLKLSVGSLVQRVEQSGDIHFRFSSRSNAQDGIRGHQKLQKSRGEGYLAEESVSDLIEYPGFHIELSGRADGCWPKSDQFIVEEIKTMKVDVEQIPEQVARLHWGQVKVYGYLLAKQHNIAEVTLRLTYYHIEQEREFSFDDVWQLSQLETEYRRMLDSYAEFIVDVRRWRERRNDSIQDLEMPFGSFRPGQREMAVSVYRALAAEGQVVLQAPTGIGKTIGSLFPATKALGEKDYARIFYMSAKTSSQQMARAAIQQMRDNGLVLRDVTLTAKEKICFNPGTACDPEYCQYARGYFDKIPNIIKQAHQSETSFDRGNVEILARQHDVCPFELSLDLTDIADVVIGDYNYVFDPTVYLRRHFDEPEKFALLMDESHNLVDRGRDMFSASLFKEDVLALKRLIGASSPGLKTALTGVNREMLAVTRDVESATSFSKFPPGLERALSRFIKAAEAWLDEHVASPYHAELLTMYFDILRFVRVGEQADENFACIVEKSPRRTMLKWFCVNPSTRLAEGFDRIASSVCFSATLSPQNYFRSLMGLGKNSDWYQLESPFDPSHLGVFVTSFLSTTYHNRNDSLYDLVDTLAIVVEAQQGNYIVYFPSYAYLRMVLAKFQERHPNHQIVVQESGMSEEARSEFLAQFEDSAAPKVGFAVMGGIFGEGIDLKGSRLIGAIIVGVGLPQIGIERNLIRDHFEADGAGFEYAYQFPGMSRVLQTAGRVIRSEQDKGVVCLIDHRFNESSYQQLFPEHWEVSQAKNMIHLNQGLAKFWQKFETGSLEKELLE